VKDQRKYSLVAPKLRNTWIAEAKKQRAAYLIIRVTDSHPLEFSPYYVIDREDVFKSIEAYHMMANSNVVEVINLSYPSSVQIDRELFTDLNLEVYKTIPQMSEYTEWQKEICSFSGLPACEHYPSQFDLEQWFERGRNAGRNYLIIIRQESVYNDFYPVYADKANLFDTLGLNQHRKFCSVCEVYNLWFDFREQYQKRILSILPKPESFYLDRSEKISLLFDNPFLDGLRRRIWEYLIECSLEHGTPGPQTYQSAYELMDYCSLVSPEDTALMRIMMLKPIELFPQECLEEVKLQPFYIVHNNYNREQWSAGASGKLMRSFEPLARQFALACLEYSFADIHCEINLNLIPDFIDRRYDITIPLSQYWKYKGTVEAKRAQVKEWMRIPGITADNLLQLKYSLTRSYDPKPFDHWRLWHRLYREIWYVCGAKEELLKHLDPDPNLESVSEMQETIALAKAGDLKSQLILGAAYMYEVNVAMDMEYALIWLTMAETAGHPTAYLLLGDLYIRRNNPNQDISKGIAYYQKAADMGYAQAYYNLAECYKDGLGLKKSYVKALAYYLAADNALQDIDDTLENGIRLMRYQLKATQIVKAESLAADIIQNTHMPDYEPLKFMYYFNPRGPERYWHRRFWR